MHHIVVFKIVWSTRVVIMQKGNMFFGKGSDKRLEEVENLRCMTMNEKFWHKDIAKAGGIVFFCFSLLDSSQT